MSDYLQSIRQQNPDLIAKGAKSALKVLFSMHADRSLQDQIQLQTDFSQAIGPGQNVRFLNVSPMFSEFEITPKGNNRAHRAESLEDCANASMFDIIAKTHQVSSIDFMDEDYDGGLDYARIEVC